MLGRGILVRSCELGEPRQSGIFFEPSLRADDRGEGGEADAAGSWQTLVVVELAESFFLTQPVELGGDDRSGTLVRGPGELGVELQGRGALRMAEAAGDGVQVGACGQELGEAPQLAGDRAGLGVDVNPE